MMTVLAVNTEAVVDVARTMAAMSNMVTYFIGLVFYVLMSWGLYALAKRRKVKKAWLAWVPLGNMWILGCLADQYRLNKNQRKDRRKKLLILNTIALVLGVLMAISALVAAVNIIDRAPNVTLTNEQILQMQSLQGDEYSEAILKLMIQSVVEDAELVNYAFEQVLVVGVLALLTTIVYVIATVAKYAALYDLFASCQPNRKVLYLLLSIFVYGAASVLVFLCKNKDWGMV